VIGVRAVLFDAGATLVHPEPAVEVVYGRELARDGATFTEEALSRALTRAWEDVHREEKEDRYGGVRGEEGFWRAFLARVRWELDGEPVSPSAFDRLAAHFRDPASWSVYDDVFETLGALAAGGWRLGIVSNWDSALPSLLEGLGIAAQFSVVAVSAIEQTGKPAPEIFRRACARLGVAPHEALHVGDSLREDYEGARGAGLQALLLDRLGRAGPGVDAIRTLREVLSRLSS